MLTSLVISPFFLAGAALGILGAILVLAGIAALMHSRPMRFALRTITGLLFLALGALVSTVAVGIQGYHAFTREDVAARISVLPAGPQQFQAAFHFSDGGEAAFALAGDEIYIDAHILKWKPLANMLGLHTAYELDRVEGRYHAIEQERSAARTIYSLSQEKLLDLFVLRRHYAFLAPLLDAEYGSATFVPVTRPAELELRVSTTGLLIREANSNSK
ncbi:MAG TPA: hypothetical protein VK460_07410 [Burkholderiales bacterium]|nr:hypothetical protein [Burkholderiales bacterium]